MRNRAIIFATAHGGLLVGLAASLGVLPAAAGEADGAALVGRVEGALAAGADVVAQCQGDPPVTRTVSAGADGSFVIEDLPAGRCRVHAEAEGSAPAFTAEVVLGPGERATLRLALRPASRAPAYAASPAPRGPGGQLPVPNRTLAAQLLLAGVFDGDRGPWGAVMGSERHGNDYRLDGFEITDPLVGGDPAMLPMLALVQPAVVAAARGAPHADSSGAGIELKSHSGSNRVEGAVLASRLGGGGARVSEAELRLTGPVMKDHAWFAAALQGIWSSAQAPGGGEVNASAPQATAKLTWQANSRNRLALLGLVSGRREAEAGEAGEAGEGTRRADSRAGLVGALWDALLNDHLFTRVQLGWRAHRHGGDGETADAAAGWQAAGMLQWFPASDHQLSLGARGEALTARLAGAPESPSPPLAPSSSPPFAGRRALLFAEHVWRPSRAVTATSGVAYAVGAFAAPAPGDAAAPAAGEEHRLAVAGATPHLGLAWDATGDGRTAVRGSASACLDTGSFSHARLAAAAPAEAPGAPRAPRTWELSAGVAREIAARGTASVDVVQRWRPQRLPGDPRAGRHRGLLLSLSKRSGGFAHAVSYVRQSTPGARDTARAAVAWAPGWGLSLGATALYGNRLGLARLAPGHFEAPAGFTAAPGGGGNGWTIALRLRASLAWALGQPLELWLDVLDLLDGRAAIGELASPGADPAAVRAPGRQLRGGVSWTY
jgi:hypothetical protein